MRLDENGNVTIAGNINAKYQDVAEWVDSSQELAPGTVVVLDSAKSNQVIASKRRYDSHVAGVISLKPGVSLGEAGEGRRRRAHASAGHVDRQSARTIGARHWRDPCVVESAIDPLEKRGLR